MWCSANSFLPVVYTGHLAHEISPKTARSGRKCMFQRAKKGGSLSHPGLLTTASIRLSLSSTHAERVALGYLGHQRREAKVIPGESRHDPVHRRLVVVFGASPDP